MSFAGFLKAIGFAALLALGANGDAAWAQPQPADAAIHVELRALRDRAVAAVNNRDADALMKELDQGIIFTAMNNEIVYGLDQAKAYYQRMMVGAGRIVENMSLTVEPDRLTQLYDNNTVGVVAGGSTAHFKLTTGNEFDVPLRWTATVHRTGDKWSILSLHFSANMFDNPALAALKASTTWIATGCGLVALIIGFFLGRLWRPRST